MTAHDEFWQRQQPAAVLKHAVLAEYTRVFASMVGSSDHSRPTWVIDGYAGAGAYEATDLQGQHPDGSPLVVLKMAEHLKNRDIRCIFIESDAKIAQQLRANVAAFKARGRFVYVLEGDVQARVQEAWSRVGGDPVVTFLDPFGVAMDWSTMTNLLLAPRPSGGPSEVLLNINLEAVWRIGGNLERRGLGFSPKPGQESGVLRADAFFGGEWWREHFLDARVEHDGSAAHAARTVVDEYRERVRQATGRKSMSVEVRRRPGHQPLFLLTLFFSHVYAGYKFADAACRATRKWRDTYRRQELEDSLADRPQESLFSDQYEIETSEADGKKQEKALDEQWIKLICENVRQSGLSQLEVARDIELILGESLGFAGERHIRQAWDLLAAENYLEPWAPRKYVHRATMRRI